MPLPDFLLIGAAKSGTTSLYHYLGQHPDVFVSPEKEPHFLAFEGHPLDFDGPGDELLIRRTVSSLPEYRALFADAEPHQVAGEASPSTLYVPEAAERAARYVPDARLIAILRNPVDRAYSNYFTMRDQGREPCSDFQTALAREEERKAANWNMFWHYKALGFYHAQLRRFYDRFDRSQIRVVIFEDFADAPASVVQELYAFLGVDPSFVPDTSAHHNPSGHPRLAFLERWKQEGHPVRRAAQALLPARLRTRIASTLTLWNRHRPPLPDDVRARLRALYREDVRRLEDLIGRDLSHWRE
jgi:hypothetical protein